MFRPSFFIYSLALAERWIEALSSIIRQFCRLVFSSWTNLSNFVKNSLKSSEVIEQSDFAAKTLPEVVIAVINDHEFLNQMFLIICSFPFGIQEKFFFVSLEKEDSSMFISNSNLSSTFHNFMANHCFIRS